VSYNKQKAALGCTFERFAKNVVISNRKQLIEVIWLAYTVHMYLKLWKSDI